MFDIAYPCYDYTCFEGFVNQLLQNLQRLCARRVFGIMPLELSVETAIPDVGVFATILRAFDRVEVIRE
jgi:hypothetical protein